MAADDIRIAWNRVTGRLCALHPDDGTYGPGIVAFSYVPPEQLPADIAKRAGHLLVGPTLAEIRAAMEET